MKPDEIIPTLHEAYDFFNEELFKGKLPKCVITLSRQSKSALGYYRHEAFEKDGDKASEIALNPDYMARGDRDSFGTLVHEMVHCQQFNFGNDIPSGGYHNKEWGKLMMKVGLTPSSTGQRGGSRTGKNMSHYIEDDGKFDEAFKKWEKKKLNIKWHSGNHFISGKEPKKKKSTPKKIKLTCPGCELKVSVPENSSLECLNCNEEMINEKI